MCPTGAASLPTGADRLGTTAWHLTRTSEATAERESGAPVDAAWDASPGLLDKVRPAFPELPPAGGALALRIWGHLPGLVALEVYGHLRAQVLAPDKLLRAELAHLLRSLGLAVD
ncbi:hypothetical protein [Streptomyces sp. 1114.5]|uniref:hypothetical protein n=1 Tax=Streptomyces sp. 1114.5 TaxID=1938830 RepID=UPI0015FFE116|nr:hypothetical protein [Streptomyces sp. 1114.5]